MQGGFCVIVDCLNSGIRKVTIKALFMISTFYTSEMSPEVQGITMLQWLCSDHIMNASTFRFI